jgi:predicted MFS family arabinose efflux permease
MGYTETQFGALVTMFGICNFLILTGAGRVGFWHFKTMPLLLVQVILAGSLLLVIFGRTIPVFAGSFVIMGAAFGFAYSSHLYYGACGSKKRSIQMAIHEATISLGVIVGSGSGGYLVGEFGVYSPYWFAVAIVALGLLAQLVVLVIGRTGRSEKAL